MFAKGFRVIDSGLCGPAFTAAADDALFTSRSKDEAPDTLHFYVRNRPTISLGYFQSVEDDIDLDFCRSRNIEVLRRTTGGSAVYTDPGQIIYALAVEDRFSKDRKEAYREICEGLIIALRELGIEAEFKPPNDVRVGGRKISGSAQKRKDGFILQHGTLIVKLDREMMFGALRAKGSPEDITSLEEIFGAAPDLGEIPAADEIKAAVARGFEKVLGAGEGREAEDERWAGDERGTGENQGAGEGPGARGEAGGFSEKEMLAIDELIAEKYGNQEWNFRR